MSMLKREYRRRCSYCGKVFYSNYSKARFCSKQCEIANKKIERSKTNLPYPKREKPWFVKVYNERFSKQYFPKKKDKE